MENLLRSKEYCHLIETGIPTVEDGAVQTEAQKEAMEALRLKDLKMKEGEKVDEYFALTLTTVNNMKVHGEKIEQIIIIEKNLKSMTSRFDYVVCSIEKSNDLSKLTIDELQSSLLVHEQRMNSHNRDDEEPQEHEAENVHEGEEQVDNGAIGSGLLSSKEAENNLSSPLRGRARRAPTWMEDHVSGHLFHECMKEQRPTEGVVPNEYGAWMRALSPKGKPLMESNGKM
ncbi:hypothetical protein JRO89_XS05G0215500 [Xanthoceras sorbifolium]|uniref:Retrovirus-related Pol polyprotein from transposon TNT 1-94 n=1 Tax=Xanthoceras sorbifolium TaxID=99658 RepID=A0ABQ8I2N8_9ROSI|nr:hypothetical protein JRO89_XS05G0215500 [Xanthoceras sorbifolium]